MAEIKIEIHHLQAVGVDDDTIVRALELSLKESAEKTADRNRRSQAAWRQRAKAAKNKS